jgi:hypothetical protein
MPQGAGNSTLYHFCAISASAAQSAEFEAKHRHPPYGYKKIFL